MLVKLTLLISHSMGKFCGSLNLGLHHGIKILNNYKSVVHTVVIISNSTLLMGLVESLGMMHSMALMARAF